MPAKPAPIDCMTPALLQADHRMSVALRAVKVPWILINQHPVLNLGRGDGDEFFGFLGGFYRSSGLFRCFLACHTVSCKCFDGGIFGIIESKSDSPCMPLYA